METCSTCKFWRKYDNHHGANAEGVCRKNSPNPKWPVTRGDSYCGDFKVRGKVLC
jgi:hypothetical protein